MTVRYTVTRKANSSDAAGCGCGCLLMAIPFLAWLTHVVTCIQDERWLFLLAGAIAFPIAIVHGIMVWLGWG